MRRPRLAIFLLVVCLLACSRLVYYSIATLREEIDREHTLGLFPIIVLQLPDNGTPTIFRQGPHATTDAATTQISELGTDIEDSMRISLGSRQGDSVLCRSAVDFLRSRYADTNGSCTGSSRFSGGHRQALLGKLMNILWTRWSDRFDPDRLTVLSTPQMVPASLVVDNPTIVPALPDEYLLVVEHCAEVQFPKQYIEVSEALGFPGYLYCYYTHVRCGTRCEGVAFYVFIDIPFSFHVPIGDVILGHQLWRIYVV